MYQTIFLFQPRFGHNANFVLKKIKRWLRAPWSSSFVGPPTNGVLENQNVPFNSRETKPQNIFGRFKVWGKQTDLKESCRVVLFCPFDGIFNQPYWGRVVRTTTGGAERHPPVVSSQPPTKEVLKGTLRLCLPNLQQRAYDSEDRAGLKICLSILPKPTQHNPIYISQDQPSPPPPPLPPSNPPRPHKLDSPLTSCIAPPG